MKINAQLHIGHYTGGPRGRGVRIAVKDNDSGIEFLALDLTHEQLGTALGACSVEVSADVRGLDRVGMVRETKVEYIKHGWGNRYGKRDDYAAHLANLCRPLEVDGWQADVSSRLRRRNDRIDPLDIWFYRFVPKPETGGAS